MRVDVSPAIVLDDDRRLLRHKSFRVGAGGAECGQRQKPGGMDEDRGWKRAKLALAGFGLIAL